MWGIMKDYRWIFSKALKIILHPAALHACNVDKTSKVCSKSELTNCEIDKYTYIGYGCFMVNTKIGRFCSIADRVSIGGAMHPMQYVSTSPVFHAGDNALGINFSHHMIPDTSISIIENDVWIGQGAFIKAGVTIGTGAVIGMGAVVTRNVGPYEVWAGNPARLIRKRFDDLCIQQLLESKWWDLRDDELKEYAESFNEPSAFLEIYKQHRK